MNDPANTAGLVDWSLSADSTITRISTRRTRPALQGAGSNYTNLRTEPPDHGIDRSRDGLSTKIYQLVYRNGLPLITPRHAGDSPMFLPLMAQLRVGRGSGRQGELLPRDPSASALPRRIKAVVP